jgi:hypothetical protein
MRATVPNEVTSAWQAPTAGGPLARAASRGAPVHQAASLPAQRSAARAVAAPTAAVRRSSLFSPAMPLADAGGMAFRDVDPTAAADVAAPSYSSSWTPAPVASPSAGSFEGAPTGRALQRKTSGAPTGRALQRESSGAPTARGIQRKSSGAPTARAVQRQSAGAPTAAGSAAGGSASAPLGSGGLSSAGLGAPTARTLARAARRAARRSLATPSARALQRSEGASVRSPFSASGPPAARVEARRGGARGFGGVSIARSLSAAETLGLMPSTRRSRLAGIDPVYAQPLARQDTDVEEPVEAPSPWLRSASTAPTATGEAHGASSTSVLGSARATAAATASATSAASPRGEAHEQAARRSPLRRSFERLGAAETTPGDRRSSGETPVERGMRRGALAAPGQARPLTASAARTMRPEGGATRAMRAPSLGALPDLPSSLLPSGQGEEGADAAAQTRISGWTGAPIASSSSGASAGAPTASQRGSSWTGAPTATAREGGWTGAPGAQAASSSWTGAPMARSAAGNWAGASVADPRYRRSAGAPTATGRTGSWAGAPTASGTSSSTPGAPVARALSRAAGGSAPVAAPMERGGGYRGARSSAPTARPRTGGLGRASSTVAGMALQRALRRDPEAAGRAIGQGFGFGRIEDLALPPGMDRGTDEAVDEATPAATRRPHIGAPIVRQASGLTPPAAHLPRGAARRGATRKHKGPGISQRAIARIAELQSGDGMIGVEDSVLASAAGLVDSAVRRRESRRSGDVAQRAAHVTPVMALPEAEFRSILRSELADLTTIGAPAPTAHREVMEAAARLEAAAKVQRAPAPAKGAAGGGKKDLEDFLRRAIRQLGVREDMERSRDLTPWD